MITHLLLEIERLHRDLDEIHQTVRALGQAVAPASNDDSPPHPVRVPVEEDRPRRSRVASWLQAYV